MTETPVQEPEAAEPKRNRSFGAKAKRRGKDLLTQEIKSQVERIAGGDKRQSEWFFRYIETGDASAAAEEVGYEAKQRSWVGGWLTKKYYPLIVEAVMLKRAAIEPLAIAWHEEVLRTEHMVPLLKRRWLPEGGSVEEAVLDENGQMVKVPDPRIMTVKNRSADSILDRGVMPKGLALHGTSPVPAGEGPSRDFRILLERLVDDFGGGLVGAAKVLELPSVVNHKEYRDFLMQRYPQPKQIEAEPVTP